MDDTLEPVEQDGTKYDTASDLIVERDGKKREPTNYETVRSVVRQQKAEKDPIERFRQDAAKNNTTLEAVLARVREYDDLPNLGERLKWVAKSHGHSDEEIVNGLMQAYTPPDPEITAAIARFDRKYSDPTTKSLRPIAKAILTDTRNDQHFQNMSHDDMLEKAFAMAWFAQQQTPPTPKEQREANRQATDLVKAKMAAKAAI